ncbi:hypothetical protein Csa_003142 [Cucumis sativus]|nr:hypothetical protein Csa_003142 [Cucumis sativus]
MTCDSKARHYTDYKLKLENSTSQAEEEGIICCSLAITTEIDQPRIGFDFFARDCLRPLIILA